MVCFYKTGLLVPKVTLSDSPIVLTTEKTPNICRFC